jgi:hypothetical protein
VREVPIASGCPGQSAADAPCEQRLASNPRQKTVDRRAQNPTEPLLTIKHRPHSIHTDGIICRPLSKFVWHLAAMVRGFPK